MNDAAVKLLSDFAQRTVNPLMLNKPDGGDAPFGCMPAMVVPDGKGTIVTLEHLGPGRARFRGIYETEFMSEFFTYVKDHSMKDESEGFVNAKGCSAVVFLNLGHAGEPGHADWRAKLVMEPTAAFKALREHEGKLLSQQAVLEFIEDYAPAILGRAPGGGESDLLPTALTAAFRNLSVAAKSEQTSAIKDLGASKTALEEIEVRSSAGLPTHLEFEATPYVGFDSRNFLLRVSIVWRENKPLITLRMVGKESVMESIAVEFKTKLLAGIGDACTMTIGSFTP
jgi:uncharacterized protein YfdQ (DUF2303 family)